MRARADESELLVRFFGTGDLQAKGSFAGGGFDGRYLYLASSGDSTTNDSTRYDTTADFLAASSWSAFNLSSVNTSTASFRGTAFDGRFVYMAPCEAGYSSVLSRYDTTAAFGAAGSWSNFDMSTIDGINPSSDGLCDIGAVFDGRYVYFVPNSIYEYWRGTVARYDPQMAFDSAAAWTTFDTLQLGALAGGFQGAAFDGRYIYFVPWGDTSTGTPLSIQGAPLITRYDTMATFTTMASWATFDPSAVTSSNAFIGAAFDGRYVYFSPGDYRGQALRYDTQASFAAGASWSSFRWDGPREGRLRARARSFVDECLLWAGFARPCRHVTTPAGAEQAVPQTVDKMTMPSAVVARGESAIAFERCGRYGAGQLGARTAGVPR